MTKRWWTVWIKVGIMAVLLVLAFNFVKDTVRQYLDPYIIEEDEVGERTDNVIKEIMEKLEEKLDIRVDYENMIFDYANGYAKDMMEQSHEDRNIQSETFTVVEETGEIQESDTTGE